MGSRTNPNRPQYQDTIDEAWGDQVADHVIRHYVDAAARDADFAGMANRDLTGQIITLGAGRGDDITTKTGLQTLLNDGSGWSHFGTNELYVQRGEGYVALDQSSSLGITFAEPFANVNFSFVISSMNPWDSPCKTMLVSRSNPNGVSVVVEKADGNGAGQGTACGYLWIAIGPALKLTTGGLDELAELGIETLGIEYDESGRPIVREQTPEEQALCDEHRELGLLPPAGYGS